MLCIGLAGNLTALMKGECFLGELLFRQTSFLQQPASWFALFTTMDSSMTHVYTCKLLQHASRSWFAKLLDEVLNCISCADGKISFYPLIDAYMYSTHTVCINTLCTSLRINHLVCTVVAISLYRTAVYSTSCEYSGM